MGDTASTALGNPMVCLPRAVLAVSPILASLCSLLGESLCGSLGECWAHPESPYSHHLISRHKVAPPQLHQLSWLILLLLVSVTLKLTPILCAGTVMAARERRHSPQSSILLDLGPPSHPQSTYPPPYLCSNMLPKSGRHTATPGLLCGLNPP